MASDGDHGTVRLDGGITDGRGSGTRDSGYFPYQHFSGFCGLHDQAFALVFLQLCLAGLNVRGVYKNRQPPSPSEPE
jgi:hypothetical protein